MFVCDEYEVPALSADSVFSVRREKFTFVGKVRIVVIVGDVGNDGNVGIIGYSGGK